MFKNRCACQFWVSGGVFLYYLVAAKVCQAQIVSDPTTFTEVTTSDNRNFTITGGSRSGANLFHSFAEFSVPNGGSAIFDNAVDVQNIITRVTGSSTSNIDGLIGAKGNANLFLINPNGIIFGPNAQLDIGGSFLASTANRVDFADGISFEATNLQPQPLLTVSVPIGLQFGEIAGSIAYRSTAEDTTGLQVKPGKTLALIGGDISVEGGLLIAPEGRIELGSVSGNNFVSLAPVPTGWTLGYEGVQNFQNIQLSQAAFVGTAGTANGAVDIYLRGHKIVIADDATFVGGENGGSNPGGSVVVNAAESVEVSNGASLLTIAFSDGKAGDIAIKTKQLLLQDAGQIGAYTEGLGAGGNITVDASESVKVIGGLYPSFLYTQTSGQGNAGILQIRTANLILSEGGQISTSTFRTGNAGTLIINASDSVEVSGQTRQVSGRSSTTSGLFAIPIDRQNRNGGSSSTGNGGSIAINTGNLLVRDGALVSVSSEGTGDAGNLDVTAGSVRLENGGKLTATIAQSGKSGGNITLQELNQLLLRNNGEISTNAQGTGNGGDIKIDTDLLIAVENSNITATAKKGQGGNIRITTQGLFVSPNSTINASSEEGIDGVVEINRPETEPRTELINLPVEIVDVSRLIAQGCSASGNVARGASKFVVTGRGGLPPTPTEVVKGEATLADLGTPVQSQTAENRASAAKLITQTNSSPNSLVEAQGWVIGSQGEVVLTAQAPTVTLDIPWLKSTTCHGS